MIQSYSPNLHGLLLNLHIPSSFMCTRVHFLMDQSAADNMRFLKFKLLELAASSCRLCRLAEEMMSIRKDDDAICWKDSP